MIEIELDGKKIEVTEGSMVMHAAEKVGVFIPHFCYHKKLSIAASCRMCLVDVEKMPKPMPACATPATQGMVVRTKSEKAIRAQQSVMEFLLINHPLDCPICDQGGECQLQDLAVGYGSGKSRFNEEKRSVVPKDVGPLISMEEMSRCIHCTRCVRFGQEIAGVMELGMPHRGEHSEIGTYLGATIDSELSGNMIDLCPVGALTSKPFRYNARTWELSRRKSVSPHDSTGSNLVVQVKNNKVARVVPLENSDVNECWLADRDRFSYEALNGSDRLTEPMLKQDGKWIPVSWQVALEYVANGLRSIQSSHGASSIGAFVSPHSTVEELYLANSLVRGLGSDNIDYRLRNREFERNQPGARYLGLPIAALSMLQRVLIIGSNIRKDHPLFAQRIRHSVLHAGCQINAITSFSPDWAMPLHSVSVSPVTDWVQVLKDVAAAIAQEKSITNPIAGGSATEGALIIARSLLTGENKAVLIGNMGVQHPRASELLEIANWIANQARATVGYLTEAANTVGAQLVGAVPKNKGLNVSQMLGGGLRAALLLNCELEFDFASATKSVDGLRSCEMVVTFSPFKANMDVSDVLLPIAPFTETSGTFINAEGRVQSFHASVRPLGDARPAWKVLRALSEILNLNNCLFDSSQEVLSKFLEDIGSDSHSFVPSSTLANSPSKSIDDGAVLCSFDPVGIYDLDSIVRRATSLQLTSDARKTDAQRTTA